MPIPLTITINDRKFQAELNDTPTAQAIVNSLPIAATGNLWGAEIYFSLDVSVADPSPTRDEFGVGEIGFWPPGNAFCLFWGPTPASRGNEPRMANPGIPIGRLLPNDCTKFGELAGRVSVQIELWDEAS